VNVGERLVNDGERLVNVGERLVNDGECLKWCNRLTDSEIIDEGEW